MAFSNYSDVEAALKAESDIWSMGEGHTNESVRQNALAAREWWNSQQNISSSSPPPPPPIPLNPWNNTPTYTAPSGVLQADPDIIVFDDTSVSPEFLTNSFYEEFGGTELINMSRSDLIDGQSVSYSPIANLSSIRQQYNPNNIIAIGILQDDLSRITIDLIRRGPNDPYFNEDGDLVVEVDIVNLDESIEVDIATSGTINRVAL